MRHKELENNIGLALSEFLEKDKEFRRAVASMRVKIYFEKQFKGLPPIPAIIFLKLVLATYPRFDWKHLNLTLLRLLAREETQSSD